MSDEMEPDDTGAAAEAERPRMDTGQLKAIIEALVFASPEPLTPKMLFKLLADEPKDDVQAALDALQADYERPGGLHLARSRRRLSDHHPARTARLGAPAVPRTQRLRSCRWRRSRRCR